MVGLVTCYEGGILDVLISVAMQPLLVAIVYNEVYDMRIALLLCYFNSLQGAMNDTVQCTKVVCSIEVGWELYPAITWRFVVPFISGRSDMTSSPNSQTWVV